MKRILFVQHNSLIGGASYCLLGVVKNIDRIKFEPIVALREKGPLMDEMLKIGVQVLLFPQMATLPYNLPFLSYASICAYTQVYRSLGAFEEVLRRENIDVVYLNTMMLAPYLYSAKRAGCKTILHVREHWPQEEHKRQLERIRQIVYNNCNKLIAINHYSASIFPQIDATIVYDWIDMENRFKRIPLNEIFNEDISEKKVFLYLGGMARIKGAYEVIKTFMDTLKGDEYRLLCMGFTKDICNNGIKSKIRRLMYNLGVPLFEYKVKLLAQTDSRIVCIPFLYDLTDILKQSYCELSYFTIPHANLPLAEAIISGIPMIAARTEESEEYSLKGKLASLYKMNDIVEFKKAIDDFVKDGSELRLALASEDRLKVEEMFS